VAGHEASQSHGPGAARDVRPGMVELDRGVIDHDAGTSEAGPEPLDEGGEAVEIGEVDLGGDGGGRRPGVNQPTFL
jgi:hypothetical protein